MIWASPSGSFSSVLLSCICRAAFTRRASRHATSRPAARSPWTSQGVIEPVSMPTLASTLACCEIRAEIGPGSVAQTPRQSRLPCVDNADRGRLLRYVQPNIMRHRNLRWCKSPGNMPGSRHYRLLGFEPRLPEVHRCCTGRGCGRIEPHPCFGSCDADVLRASEVQHLVQ